MPKLVPRASSFFNNTTLITVLSTFVILITFSVCLFFSVRRAMRRAGAHPQSSVIPASILAEIIVPFPPMSYSPSGLPSHGTTLATQPHHTSSASQSTVVPPQLDTVFKGYETTEGPIMIPVTLDSESTTTSAVVVPPYDLVGVESQDEQVNMVNIHSAQSNNQMGLLVSYLDRAAEEVEVGDSDSILLPSDISFEDSLFPPEYQSAWGGRLSP